MKSGLVKRKNGRYALTAFGKVIYDVQITIEKVISNYYWNLKAIDSLKQQMGGFQKMNVTRYWTL